MPTIYVALDTGLGLSSLCVSWDALAIAASQPSGGLASRDAAVEMSSVPSLPWGMQMDPSPQQQREPQQQQCAWGMEMDPDPDEVAEAEELRP